MINKNSFVKQINNKYCEIDLVQYFFFEKLGWKILVNACIGYLIYLTQLPFKQEKNVVFKSPETSFTYTTYFY